MRIILTARRAPACLLVAALTMGAGAAGCTASPGGAAGTRTSTAPVVVAPAARAVACRGAEVRAGIVGFFTAWNHRDAAALRRLFTTDGVLDMATRSQNTLHGSAYASTGGRGARRLIAAFAERQWAEGERLLYREVTAVTGSGLAGAGGGALVVARFPDGTTQPMVEAKFVYDCTARVRARRDHLRHGRPA